MWRGTTRGRISSSCTSTRSRSGRFRSTSRGGGNAGQPPERDRGEETVPGEVTPDVGAGDAARRAASGMEIRQRCSLRIENTGVRIDDETALRVEKRAGHFYRVVGRRKRRPVGEVATERVACRARRIAPDF